MTLKKKIHTLNKEIDASQKYVEHWTHMVKIEDILRHLQRGNRDAVCQTIAQKEEMAMKIKTSSEKSDNPQLVMKLCKVSSTSRFEDSMSYY
jgi:hypothetical protein